MDSRKFNVRAGRLSAWPRQANSTIELTSLRQPPQDFADDGGQQARSGCYRVTLQTTGHGARMLIAGKPISAGLAIRRTRQVFGTAFFAFVLHAKNMPKKAKGRKKLRYLRVLEPDAGPYYAGAVSYFCADFRLVYTASTNISVVQGPVSFP